MSRFLQFILSLFKINGSSRPLKREGQQVFAGFLAYDWSRQSYSETRKYVNACVESGFTGITFELMERMADWPRGEKVEDVARRMEEQVQKIGIWISECRRAGLWARIIINNSNADVNRTLVSPSPFLVAANNLKGKYGQDNLLILPVSEKDSDLKEAFRVAIINHCEALFDRGHTIAYSARRPDALWLETHMKDPAISARGDYHHIAVSDTGDILRKLHTDGVTGQIPVVEAWETFVRSNLKAGVSVCCYAFHKKPNYGLVSRLSKVTKEAAK